MGSLRSAALRLCSFPCCGRFSLVRRRTLFPHSKLSTLTKMVNVSIDQKSPSVVTLLTIEHLKRSACSVNVEHGSDTHIKLSCNATVSGETAVSRYLAKFYPEAGLYGATPLDKSQVDSWLDFSNLHLKNASQIEVALEELNRCLAPSTYLVGYAFTLADFAVWGALHGNTKWSSLLDSGKADEHVARWFNFCLKQPLFSSVLATISVPSNGNPTEVADAASGPRLGKALKSTMEEGGKFFDLPGASRGNVVVRFPPEASGYLHIGHAKAALMNQYYKDLYDGKLIMRFDDTNPEKENAEFEKIILDDIKLLHLTPDLYSRTSDHFEIMLKYAEQLIVQGDAYCDNTPAEKMKQLREERLPSPNRDLSVERNLEMWKAMIAGTPEGMLTCLRAKIDFKSDNGCLRDPVLYRCREEKHLIHGDKYCVYPTYDFACPIVDSVENVTHALRTSEYLDRDPQYAWILEKLNMRKPYIYSYSRLALVNTVLSKRKLTYLVDQGIVDGWDDPRMPTVRGVLRRGMTVEGLKEFIVAQGSSKSNVHMEWDKIWSFNKKVIDPIAPRYSALLKSEVVPVNVVDAVESSASYPLHPKSTDVGDKMVYYSKRVYIEGEDACNMKEDELVTFINWGNLRIIKILKDSGGHITSMDAKLELENKDFKKTTKITWLAEHPEAPLVPTICSLFDHIISKDDLNNEDDFKDYINKNTRTDLQMLGDPCLKDLKKGDIIQLQRRGYFICDEPYEPKSRYSGREHPCILFHIPDGSTSGMMNQGKEKGKPSGSNSGGSSSKIEKKQKKQQKQGGVEGEPLKPVDASREQALYHKVVEQGDKIRTLKAVKTTSKEELAKEVNVLKELKEEYKAVTGKDYAPPGAAPATRKPDSAPIPAKEMAPVPTAGVGAAADADALLKQIQEQGETIRKMKAENAHKSLLQPEIDKLLKLKADYKALTGLDPSPPSTGGKKDKKENKNQAEKKAAPQKKEVATTPTAAEAKKQTRLGLEAKKEEALSDWYSQVITKSELIEYYDVSGCYILRPWAFSMWERIQAFFDKRIKTLGVQNCYFPMFVSQAALEKEKTHIADFAPEVAWVTRSGQSELAEPIAIRPTSETVMYPTFAKWVQSHRDLPIRLNQWCNVVRWEFKHPQPFLRTREFLWQEGHTAFATRPEAEEEVYQILDFYSDVYTDLMAIPVIKGRKTEKEKFAGGDFTTTIEAYIAASGRAIQGATSHHLGQNFSKMFGITFEDPNNPESKEKCFAHQNSWGITTRTIGVVVMVHGDNQGLVLPPRLAAVQVIVVPVGITATTSADEEKLIRDSCTEYVNGLAEKDVRAQADFRDNYSPGWKFNHWELKGVPIRIELGPRDIKSNQFVAVRRDTGEKLVLKKEKFADQLSALLETIQADMYKRAEKQLGENLAVTCKWEEFLSLLDRKKIIQAPFCGEISCEEKIKKDSTREESAEAGGPSMGAKSLCIPFKQPAAIEPGTKCFHPACNNDAKFYTLFGRSY